MSNPSIKNELFFNDLINESRYTGDEQADSKPNIDFNRQIAEIPESEWLDFIISIVSSQTAKILGIRRNKSLSVSTSFKDLGLDSLMALELKNALSATTGLTLQSTLVYDFPTIDLLANYLLGEITKNQMVDAKDNLEGQNTDKNENTATGLDALSQDELAKLLAKKILLLNKEN
jgi:acyl carrier protein